MTEVFRFFIDYVLKIINWVFYLPITDYINFGWFLIACCLIGFLVRIIFCSFGSDKGGNS